MLPEADQPVGGGGEKKNVLFIYLSFLTTSVPFSLEISETIELFSIPCDAFFMLVYGSCVCAQLRRETSRTSTVEVLLGPLHESGQRRREHGCSREQVSSKQRQGFKSSSQFPGL